jgi:hypothetical protein
MSMSNPVKEVYASLRSQFRGDLLLPSALEVEGRRLRHRKAESWLVLFGAAYTLGYVVLIRNSLLNL